MGGERRKKVRPQVLILVPFVPFVANLTSVLDRSWPQKAQKSQEGTFRVLSHAAPRAQSGRPGGRRGDGAIRQKEMQRSICYFQSYAETPFSSRPAAVIEKACPQCGQILTFMVSPVRTMPVPTKPRLPGFSAWRRRGTGATDRLYTNTTSLAGQRFRRWLSGETGVGHP